MTGSERKMGRSTCFRRSGLLPLFLLLFSHQLQAEKVAEVSTVFYETSIAPILKNHCQECHNPDKRKGDLDLSSPAGLIRGGENGPVFKRGEALKSHLFELVHSGKMPKKGEALPPVEVETIRRWIETGAPFQKQPEPGKPKLTQHDVLPIVLLRCTACHGPHLREGGLDLRSPASMKKGGISGPAIIPGNPDGSLMIQRIESKQCPPSELLLKFFVKRPPSSEVRILREWIAQGAPLGDVKPDVATRQPDPLVSDEDRRHWAFQAPRAGPGSIDGFVHKRLYDKGLDFSPEADRDTLIRRVYFDLVGMPPSGVEWEKWHGSKDPDWYRKMVDELLSSPHYGERWGRYWLDLAGYANSEGGVSADTLRRVAWKYRDYVIGAFNQDKPYDEFLVQQIAGDELIDCERAKVVTDEMVENLVATGFLRMGIDQTGSRTMNFVPERLGVINDALHIVSSRIMGLTMKCARCHSHKYDPIPQRDYYRLKAIFQGAFDEHDWMSFKTRNLEIGTAEQKQRIATINPPLTRELKSLEADQRKAVAAMQREVMSRHYPGESKTHIEETLVALKKASNVRTLLQARLVEKYQRAVLKPDSQQPESVLRARKAVTHARQKIARVRSQMEPPLAIRALWDRGAPSPTYILRRGEYDKPGRLVGPGVPSALTDGRTPLVVEPPFSPGGTPKTGRRLAFARWLTQADNPLTSRVMVNRIWRYHFGAGLVRTLDNFGVKGDRPSHPELLDWLAVEFVKRGWSIKSMHRLIMNSKTYKQSGRITDDRFQIDPQNRLLSRMALRRMDAEALRDSLLFVAGKLDDTPGGLPDPITAKRDGLITANPTANGGWRRSVYLQFRRTQIPTMMDTFDYPEMGPNCIARTQSTVSPQALMLMNNLRVKELSEDFATRVRQILGKGKRTDDPAASVNVVYQLALSRLPSEEELRLGVATLKLLAHEWKENPNGPLETYCHTILNSAGFLYID